MKNSTSLIPFSLLIALSGCLSPDMKTESIGKRVNVIWQPYSLIHDNLNGFIALPIFCAFTVTLLI